MLAQADHNNMDSLSKQHERNKMADSMVHFQRSDNASANFKHFPAEHAPGPS